MRIEEIYLTKSKLKTITNLKSSMLKLLLLSIAIANSNAYTCSKEGTCNVCGDKMIVLDPSLDLGKMNCTDTGKYSRMGCIGLRNTGNLVCKLTPLEKPIDGNCYHIHCTWKEQDNYRLTFDVKPPYDTIQVTMTPWIDLTPGWTLSLFLILLLVWGTLLCNNPEVVCLICLSNTNHDRYGERTLIG